MVGLPRVPSSGVFRMVRFEVSFLFPTRGVLHVAFYTDETFDMEQFNKVNFWYQEYFHGVNLSSLRNTAGVLQATHCKI